MINDDCANQVDHYVSHGSNIYWHLYPQVLPDCNLGASTNQQPIKTTAMNLVHG